MQSFVYLELSTGEYPLSASDVRNRFNGLIPEPFEPPEGFVNVEGTQPPEYNPVTESVRELPPAQLDGVWKQVWEVYSVASDTISQNTSRYISNVVFAIQNHLDTEAKLHSYDGILSACSYATSESPKFGPEGRACVIWRDAVWSAGYQILNDVQTGARALPTVAQVISELPTITWPS